MSEHRFMLSFSFIFICCWPIYFVLKVLIGLCSSICLQFIRVSSCLLSFVALLACRWLELYSPFWDHLFVVDDLPWCIGLFPTVLLDILPFLVCVTHRPASLLEMYQSYVEGRTNFHVHSIILGRFVLLNTICLILFSLQLLW